MKEMVAVAKPESVHRVADAWKALHDHLVGGGSIKGDFDKAVDHILKRWEGKSADEFAKKAKKISKQIADCAKYADYTSTAMRNAGDRLQDIKPKVEAIKKPGTLDKAGDKIGDGFTRDDTEWKKDLNGNQGAQSALDNNDGDLSAGKEKQLECAALMESLALTYTSQTKTMGSWEKKPRPDRRVDDYGEYPGDPGGVAPVPVGVTPDGGGPGTAAPGGAKTTPSTGGVSTPKTGSPAAATKIDGISGGTASKQPPAAGANAGGTGPGGGIGTGGGATGGAAGGPGLVGQASGNRGIAGGAKGSGGRAPAGLGGRMGGGSGAGGAAGKGAGSGAGRGPLARARGGAADTPGQAKGAARQGGQGLHSSRGGTQAGDRGRNNGLMRGGTGTNQNKRNENEKSQGQRPDYLVEDEETWMPKRRDVAPPTIG